MQKPPPTQWPDVLEQQHVEGCSVFANRKLLIESLAACRGGTICEIGVEYGFFSEFLLRTLQPKLFHAFDLFDLHNQERHGEHRPKDIFQGRTHLQYYTRKFNAQIHDGTLKAFMGDSSEYLSDQPDQFYDLIYVDGDHTLEGVKKDTDVAVEKIKPEGVLVFNDYIMSDCVNPWVATYGVVQAVNDLCINHGWRMHAFALQSSMFCDVALVRR